MVNHDGVGGIPNQAEVFAMIAVLLVAAILAVCVGVILWAGVHK